MELINPFDPIFWKAMGLAIACGGLIGLERQIRGKPAGIRTSILICFSTATFVHLGAAVAGAADPTRVLGQVVTGVGFLGAGVIMAREGIVTGMTSAAAIWMLAAVGACIGMGQFGAAAMLTLMTLLVLLGVEILERRFYRLRTGVHHRSPGHREGDG